jgi:hypothetical protein
MRTKTLGYVPCWKTGQRAYHRTVKPEDVESNVAASSGNEALAVAKPLLTQPTPVGYCRALILADRLVTETAEFAPLPVVWLLRYADVLDAVFVRVPTSSIPNPANTDVWWYTAAFVPQEFAVTPASGHRLDLRAVRVFRWRRSSATARTRMM